MTHTRIRSYTRQGDIYGMETLISYGEKKYLAEKEAKGKYTLTQLGKRYGKKKGTQTKIYGGIDDVKYYVRTRYTPQGTKRKL